MMRKISSRYYFIVLVMIVIFISPVSADIRLQLIASILLIEKDGTPFNASVNFSLECFGHYKYPKDPPSAFAP